MNTTPHLPAPSNPSDSRQAVKPESAAPGIHQDAHEQPVAADAGVSLYTFDPEYLEALDRA